jgi:anti-sigma B factor antagonist
MNITERQAGSITLLAVSGKITSDNPGQLKDRVTSVLDRGDKAILIDLSGVTYIDSSGLGEMVSCHTTATRQKAAIKLTKLGARSKDLLVMTKLIMVFDVYDTEAEAIASFGHTV